MIKLVFHIQWMVRVAGGITAPRWRPVPSLLTPRAAHTMAALLGTDPLPLGQALGGTKKATEHGRSWLPLATEAFPVYDLFLHDPDTLQIHRHPLKGFSQDFL